MERHAPSDKDNESDTPATPPAHRAVVVPPDEPTPSDKVTSNPLPSTPTPAPVPPVARHEVPSSTPPRTGAAPQPDTTRRPPLPNPQHLRGDEKPVDVPVFEAFSFSAGRPLTAEEMQTITLFHEQYHQKPAGEWTAGTLRDAKRDAETVLPLMQRQLEIAAQNPEGARGGEARQIQANIDWVTQLVQL